MDGKPECERRSLAHLAFETNVAAEQLREPPRDCQTQPSAALHRVSTGAGVDLFKFLEDPRLIGRRDSNASVDDLQRDPHAFAVWCVRREHRIVGGMASCAEATDRRRDQTSANGHAAGRCVLHGIPDQIDENLTEVRWIGSDARQRITDRD